MNTAISRDGAFSEREVIGELFARALLVARIVSADVGPWLRRAVDVVGALAMLVVAAPVLVLAAIAIKATSRGPVLFQQPRVGIGGRTFMMLKLRTMFTGAEAQKTALAAANAGATSGVRFKLRRDPRVTAIGRVLRKLSIDELPQIWNVLRGEMTFVGPRPAVPREVRLYDPHARRRLEVTPGLTCLWQVQGRSDVPFDKQVELDLEYVDRTHWHDELTILLRTIPAVLSGRGAY